MSQYGRCITLYMFRSNEYLARHAPKFTHATESGAETLSHPAIATVVIATAAHVTNVAERPKPLFGLLYENPNVSVVQT